DVNVMLSVIDRHHIAGIRYEFEDGKEVIPYMAPHEVRILFGGASHGNSHVHTDHHGHVHADARIV
ncbi:MAG: urease accessory protein UreE, partial [Muribaculaceae bacterium]|nr:urease accessory protein UreE [Muribaculaceae bacterium]